MPRIGHVIPNDERGHELTSNCPCHPVVVPIRRADGRLTGHQSILHSPLADPCPAVVQGILNFQAEVAPKIEAAAKRAGVL